MAKINKKKDQLQKATGEIMKIGKKTEPTDQDPIEDQQKESDQVNRYSRAGEGTEKGRKRYTTMIHPELKKRARSFAEDQAKSVPDIIEEALDQYLKSKGY
jgi:predicted HicB family RNase H-like nuclease